MRAWEALGLVSPQRTQSRYRLFTEADVRLLQRAMFLRRARGLNPAAIVHVLKKQGMVPRPRMRRNFPASAFVGCACGVSLSLAQVAGATDVSVGFLSALERGQMRCSMCNAAPHRALLQNEHNVSF